MAAVRALIVIGLAPLFCVILVMPLQLWWIVVWQVQHIAVFTVIDCLQTPHVVLVPGSSLHHQLVGVAEVTFVGERGQVEVSAIDGGCLGLWAGKPQVGEDPCLSVIEASSF